MASKLQNDVVIWQDRIDKSIKLRDKKKKEIRKYIAYYKGNQWSNPTKLKEKPVTNLIFKEIKTQLPYLCFQNPKWLVSAVGPKKKEHYKNLANAQYYLNYYARENLRISLKRQLRFAILDAFFWFGAMKTGYQADIEIPNIYKKTKFENKETGETSTIYMNENGEIVENPKEIVTNEKFLSRRITPGSLSFDREAISCFEDGKYIIEEINLILKNVKKDKRYSNTIDLQPSYEIASSLSSEDKKNEAENSKDLHDELSRIIAYEIYDLENNEILVLPKDHDKLIRKDSMPDGIDGHPYSFLVFNDIPDEMYPLPDIKVQISPQDDYNKAVGIINEHAKKFARKYGYIEGMIEEDQLELLKNPEDGTLFKVKKLPLGECIEPLADPTLDPATDKMLATALFNFREAGGSTEQERGQVERRKTAYEASKMTESLTVRKQDRRSLVEDFASDVGTKLLQSMQKNLTVEDTVKIGNKNDDSDWLVMNKENIAGQFNAIVEMGSMTPKLPELERQDFGLVLQAISQFPPDLIESHVNFSELLKAIPQMFPSLENIEFINSDDKIKSIQAEQTKRTQVEYLLQLAQSQKTMPIGENKTVGSAQ